MSGANGTKYEVWGTLPLNQVEVLFAIFDHTRYQFAEKLCSYLTDRDFEKVHIRVLNTCDVSKSEDKK